MTKQLEDAIQAKDSAAIVAALSGMTEEQREAAREPLLIWLYAMGFDRGSMQLLGTSIKFDIPEVKARREADNIVPMCRVKGPYDYEMSWIASLAVYGLIDRGACQLAGCVNDYEAESAQVMADRQPPWFDEWLAYVTRTDPDQAHRNIKVSFWCRLHRHSLIHDVNEDWVKANFVHQLAESYSKAQEATQHVLQQMPTAVDAVYDVPQHEHLLFEAKDWGPVVQFIGGERLLDHQRFLTACTDAIERLTNQTERNGCVILAKAASHKSAKCPAETLAELQSSWVGLLSDQQTAVAGFGLEQLVAVEKAGLLQVEDAVADLPHIFQHKPKNHALKAVKLMNSIIKADVARSTTLQALASSLSHANKDVQEAGLECLAEHLRADDSEAIAAVSGQSEMVAATLRSQLKTLLDSLQTSSDRDEATATQTDAGDLDSLIERANGLAPESREKFGIDAAIDVASRGELAPIGKWRMTDVRVLDSQPKLDPIESLDELFDITAAAVERCESADIPEQIVDGIMRFGRERPDSFEARKKPLAKRACCEAMERPNRGIVGGVLGDAFVELICAWLEVPFDDDDDWICNYYPMSPFLREVAGLLKRGKKFQLLSTPTHAGGWIDPFTWVKRLQDLEASEIEFLESDLIRSLLRLTPDGRDDALRKISTGEVALSEKVQKLTTLILDLDKPNDTIALDDSWSPFVWMAAIRARDPWIDLQDHLPEDEQAQVAPELWDLPDVLKPCDYQWRVKESDSHSFLITAGLVNSHPMPGEAEEQENAEPFSLEQLLAQLAAEREEEQQDSSGAESPSAPSGAFLAAQLNYLTCYPAPQFVYSYLATQWPLKLEWYWNLATIGLSRRVESGPSVDERYDQFLLPLFEPDRPLCRMAARALWIATVSKDGNARGMATEVWIALLAEERLPVDIAAAALWDVFAGGWIKMNRIAEVFTEVSVVSPLHAFTSALLLEQFLTECTDFPRDTAKLLQVLNECNESLARSVPKQLSGKLSSIKSGKARKLARALMDREYDPTDDRHAAIATALTTRIDRAGRNGGIVSQEATSQ